MNKELIERYIQTAIDNWFNKIQKINNIEHNMYYMIDNDLFQIDWYTIWHNDICYNFIELITSKEFIEAISEFLYNNNIIYRFSIKESAHMDLKENAIDTSITHITRDQAKAIRDNKLEDFIKLIKWDEQINK